MFRTVSYWSKLLLVFLLASSVFWSCEEAPQDIKPPNILWLVLEDMSPQFIGAYGNPAANTPVIDSLIEEGVKFEAAFSTGTVCSPSRYAIITGTRTNEYGTGHHRSNIPIPDSIKPFPAYLKEMGYHTSNNAKRDYNTSARRRITQESWVETSYEAGWWNRQDGQPFFSVFNFDNCHQSRTFTNPYDNYKARILNKIPPDEVVSPADIVIPDFYKDTMGLRVELSRTYNALKKTDMEVDSILNLLRKDQLIDSTIIFLYSDHGGGALNTKSKGGALGHQVPMAVVFPPAYAHLNPYKKQSIAIDRPITFEDLAPTVLTLADTIVPEYMTGESFLGQEVSERSIVYCSSDRCGEANDLTRSVSDGRYFYTRVFMPNQMPMAWNKYFDYSKSRQLARQYSDEGALNDIQKSLFEPRPREMLYDLKKDTWQTNNLADLPEHQEKIDELRSALDKQLIEAKDVHFIPEFTLDSISKNGTPFDYKESADYNFQEIYEMAKLAGGGSEVIPQQMKGLESQNPVVRYWAAIGLNAQESAKLISEARDISPSLSDDYPPVSIEIAYLMYNHFDNLEAKEVLQKYLKSDNEFLSVQVAQRIVYLPSRKAEPFLSDVKTLKQQQIPGNLSESLDIFMYIQEGEDLYYAQHW
ncbi:MAG: sulfatase-like hydrolase/transferase [Bacteroidota bacterium]